MANFPPTNPRTVYLPVLLFSSHLYRPLAPNLSFNRSGAKEEFGYSQVDTRGKESRRGSIV